VGNAPDSKGLSEWAFSREFAPPRLITGDPVIQRPQPPRPSPDMQKDVVGADQETWGQGAIEPFLPRPPDLPADGNIAFVEVAAGMVQTENFQS